MVVPLILGKMFQDIFSGKITVDEISFLPLFIGFLFAFLTGLFACKWMIKIVKNSQLKYFSYYCLIIGSTVIITSLL